MLGADQQSSGAARWAVDEPNIMNVAATRAKEEFYIIGDKSLYLGLGCDVATSTNQIIRQYKKQFPELVDDDVKLFKSEKTKILPETVLTQINQVNKSDLQVQDVHITKEDCKRVTGIIKYVGKGSKCYYAYVNGDDGKEYSITESIYLQTNRAIEVIQKGNKISFVPEEGKKKTFATDVKLGK